MQRYALYCTKAKIYHKRNSLAALLYIIRSIYNKKYEKIRHTLPKAFNPILN